MNCVAIVLVWLQCVGIELQTIPSIAVTEAIPYAGIYTGSRVYIKDPNNCEILLHEFIHHAQFLDHGPATSAQQWWHEEVAAHRLTKYIVGRCQ